MYMLVAYHLCGYPCSLQLISFGIHTELNQHVFFFPLKTIQESLERYKEETDEKYALIELRIKDLVTGNRELEAEVQEKSKVILVKDSLLR